MHLVSCLLFLSSSHFSLSAPVCFVSKPLTPFPCMSRCVAAGAASFFPFFLTLSKGMDSGSWGCFISAPGRNPPPSFMGGPKATGCFSPSSPPDHSFLCHGSASPIIWESGTSRKKGSLGLPYLSLPAPPSFGLAWLPAHLLLGGTELRGRCFRPGKKKKMRGGRDKKPPPFSTSHTVCTQFLPHLGS